MKTLILLGATLALGLAIAPANAQTQTTTNSTTTTGYIQSSTVVGSKIKDSRGEEVGVIKDFVLDRNTGCLAYVVVSASKGGVLSSSKTVAAPWSVFSVSSDPRVYTTRIEREKIYSAPVWESTRVEEYSRTDYINNVYGYYGVTAPRFNAEMSVGVTNTTNTTTNPATTTNTSASTNATAAPTVSASPSASVAASPTAAASATPAASASVNPSLPPSPSATAATTTEKAAAPLPTFSPAKPKASPTAVAKQTPNEMSGTDSARQLERESKKAKANESTDKKSDSSSSKSTKSTKKTSPEPESTPKEP